jgi:hypothetical protein
MVLMVPQVLPAFSPWLLSALYLVRGDFLLLALPLAAVCGPSCRLKIC